MFADVPHLIKLLRNHFMDHGISINGEIVTKQALIELLKETNGKDLIIAHKLTDLHLTVKNAGRQKVKLATQLFSHTNSKAVLRMGDLGMFSPVAIKDYKACANLLKVVF